jgi:hypothetical protein|tara:strand:- start:9075 stop:9326 length:252 start_codon:yes stop_codon:yes gene_type:complete
VIKVWFLLVLINFPEYPIVYYKGVKSFESLENCQEQMAPVKNFFEKKELDKGKTAISIESYCLPFYTFKSIDINNEARISRES